MRMNTVCVCLAWGIYYVVMCVCVCVRRAFYITRNEFGLNHSITTYIYIYIYIYTHTHTHAHTHTNTQRGEYWGWSHHTHLVESASLLSVGKVLLWELHEPALGALHPWTPKSSETWVSMLMASSGVSSSCENEKILRLQSRCDTLLSQIDCKYLESDEWWDKTTVACILPVQRRRTCPWRRCQFQWSPRRAKAGASCIQGWSAWASAETVSSLSARWCQNLEMVCVQVIDKHEACGAVVSWCETHAYIGPQDQEGEDHFQHQTFGNGKSGRYRRPGPWTQSWFRIRCRWWREHTEGPWNSGWSGQEPLSCVRRHCTVQKQTYSLISKDVYMRSFKIRMSASKAAGLSHYNCLSEVTLREGRQMRDRRVVRLKRTHLDDRVTTRLSHHKHLMRGFAKAGAGMRNVKGLSIFHDTFGSCACRKTHQKLTGNDK